MDDLSTTNAKDGTATPTSAECGAHGVGGSSCGGSSDIDNMVLRDRDANTSECRPTPRSCCHDLPNQPLPSKRAYIAETPSKSRCMAHSHTPSDRVLATTLSLVVGAAWLLNGCNSITNEHSAESPGASADGEPTAVQSRDYKPRTRSEAVALTCIAMPNDSGATDVQILLPQISAGTRVVFRGTGLRELREMLQSPGDCAVVTLRADRFVWKPNHVLEVTPSDVIDYEACHPVTLPAPKDARVSLEGIELLCTVVPNAWGPTDVRVLLPESARGTPVVFSGPGLQYLRELLQSPGDCAVVTLWSDPILWMPDVVLEVTASDVINYESCRMPDEAPGASPLMPP
jgi:hypothetical protein